MKRFAVAFALTCASLVAPARADDPAPRLQTEPLISASEITPTTEMWLYQQELRRYENPKNAIRANAEFRSSQRRSRIAAMKWYGLSPSRPAPNGRPYPQNWVARPFNPTYEQPAGNGAILLQADNAGLRQTY